MNNLETSFAAVRSCHGLTTFAVAYRGEGFGPAYRFQASGHFDDAAEGQIPCATGDGDTIETAIRNMLAAVSAKRKIALLGDEALWSVEQEQAA